MTAWQPGMRCVCVDDSPVEWPRFYPFLPKKGFVYTVRDVRFTSAKCGVSLRLVEVVNPTFPEIQDGESVFRADRFRPLSETSLDQFRIHLAPVPTRETV